MSSHPLVLCLVALSVASPALAQRPRKAAAKGAVLASPPPPPADVKVRTRYVSGTQVSENTAYFKGLRQRFEFPGIAMVTQCDLGRTLQLNEATRHYLVVPAEAVAPGSASDPAAAAPPPQPPGGVVTETTTLTDTGERKRMFGLEARHVKTVIVRQPGENACDPESSRIEVDGWYVDLPDRADCPAVPAPAPSAATGAACHDRIETRQVGAAKVGFAVSSAITTITEEGKDVRTTSLEVTDLQVTTLEPALFEVPAGYTQVQSYRDLVPALSGGGSLADVVFGSLADGTSTLAPKKPGVIRIGIVDPANKSGQPLPMAPFQGGLIASFSKAPFEALRVGGATPDDIDHDATQKACDFILLAEVTELKASKPGKVGGLLRRASGDLNAASEVHEARVDYRLHAVGNPGKPRLAGMARASSGGGFGVGSALKVAKFAGSLYLGMSGRLMGGMGMMGPYASLMGSGGGLKTRLMNPGMGAALSLLSQGQTMSDPGMSGARQTVEQALAKAGRQVAEELQKSKS